MQALSTTARVLDSPDSGERGFTILELVVSTAILMLISGLMLQGVVEMSRLNEDQSNRSEMHAGIRNATALLQQEVGQAGRVSLPAPLGQVSLVNPVTADALADQPVRLSSTEGIFLGVGGRGMQLIVGHGAEQEVVEVRGINGSEIVGRFRRSHPAGARVAPAGGFAQGVIPTSDRFTNGSTDSVLKIVGDVNGDGRIMYVEYTCSWEEGRLYRNMMPYTEPSKPDVTVEQVLLDNLLPNPPDPDGRVPPCFTYEQQRIDTNWYVINVAIMTTVRTHDRHPITGEFLVITKALLNVAPRNVFHTWQIASLGRSERIQPLPASVLNLLN